MNSANDECLLRLAGRDLRGRRGLSAMLEFGLEATAHGDKLVSLCHGQRGTQQVVGAVGIGWAELFAS